VLQYFPSIYIARIPCYPGDGEQADVTVAYDSADTEDVKQDGGKRLKSGRLRRRRSSQFNSLASFRSVDSRSRQADSSLRCVSVRSSTQGSADVYCLVHSNPHSMD